MRGGPRWRNPRGETRALSLMCFTHTNPIRAEIILPSPRRLHHESCGSSELFSTIGFPPNLRGLTRAETASTDDGKVICPDRLVRWEAWGRLSCRHEPFRYVCMGWHTPFFLFFFFLVTRGPNRITPYAVAGPHARRRPRNNTYKWTLGANAHNTDTRANDVSVRARRLRSRNYPTDCLHRAPQTPSALLAPGPDGPSGSWACRPRPASSASAATW